MEQYTTYMYATVCSGYMVETICVYGGTYMQPHVHSTLPRYINTLQF